MYREVRSEGKTRGGCDTDWVSYYSPHVPKRFDLQRLANILGPRIKMLPEHKSQLYNIYVYIYISNNKGAGEESGRKERKIHV